MRLISKAVSQFPNARLANLNLTSGKAEIECREGDFEEIKKKIQSKGYGTSEWQAMETVAGCKEALCCGSKIGKIKNIIVGIAKGKEELAFERKLIAYSIAALIVIGLLQFAIFQSVLQNANYSIAQIPLMALLAISTAAIVTSYYHQRIYSQSLSCMSGMMVGMTIGMVSGLLFGSIIGASNGMFWGSITGMAVGMAFGAAAGRTSGIMAILEGLMAGLMGGTMGAMLSVMMLNENFLAFITIFIVSCTTILAGLSYMIFKEGQPAKTGISLARFLALSVAIAIASNLLMAFGPRGLIFWQG